MTAATSVYSLCLQRPSYSTDVKVTTALAALAAAASTATVVTHKRQS